MNVNNNQLIGYSTQLKEKTDASKLKHSIKEQKNMVIDGDMINEYVKVVHTQYSNGDKKVKCTYKTQLN
ncbi:unnamed protein product [Paramecium sonneborni]|uniref:Uncharacterized protein n=1 Tax=Paramecium sonneborni TaxID=65129 RepID=A0A8S1PMP6_9CILI|nr:unnamed protein product [Paramecium sonneborni]